MKQVVRRVIDRKGRIKVLELPDAHLGADQVLVESHFSLISSGTELSTIRKTPAELVRQTVADPWMRDVVKQTILSAGLSQTAGRVWQELIMPREIGYSGAGRVLALGDDVEGFRVGDKVAYAATGHAEVVAPTINHIVPVPESVDLRHAAFVTVGGIALHAVRRAEVELGETVVVYGLGLIGQICAMIAKAAGAVVIGIDISAERLATARSAGVDVTLDPADDDVSRRVMDATAKNGADKTIICASSSSSEIINSAMEITRRQGVVVIVGYVKLDIHPKNFLYREIDLRYSRAYGPGSYHRAYENRSVDYPFAYVRWTEKRNLAEVIRLIGSGDLNLESLIGASYPIDRAQDAFTAIAEGKLGGIAALLEYDGLESGDDRRTVPVRPRPKAGGKVGISIIGVGNHVLGHHLPHLKSIEGVEIRGLASATGKNAAMVAERYGATTITTDVDELLADPDTDGVLICSSQPEHFGHLRAAIAAGKAVYVEKPMVTRLDQFTQIARLMSQDPVPFTLGLNRRYSPMVAKLRELLTEPIETVSYQVNLPFVPPDHWSLDEVDGAGRLIAEGEHFLDVCNLLVGTQPLTVYARSLGEAPDDLRALCNCALTVHYDGAVANVVINESAAAGVPRERVTVTAKGQTATLEDFAELEYRGRRKKSLGRSTNKQMGHAEALSAFVGHLRGATGGPEMLDWEGARRATATIFAAQESIRSGQPVDLRVFMNALLSDDSAQDDG
ncbi:MAG: bi-domain-containing oxidoreductase [Thermoanaerobaculia bacterium]